MTTLNLDSIIDVSVEVSPSSAPRATFNQLLIVGTNGLTISDPITTTERVREYTATTDMLTDGFITTDAEYLAAVKYFGQSPAPDVLWVGVRDNTTSPEESVLEALIACRAVEADWYICYSVEATSADIEEIAPVIETMTPSTIFAYNSANSNILTSNPTPLDICTTLKNNSYQRTIGQYSSISHAIVTAMGRACGLNNGNANSAFTLMGKNLIGITTESLTSSQRSIVEAKNCNLYLYYANYYSIFEQGVMANGYFFDQIMNRDMLVNDIQLSCMDLIYQNRKIPQTEAGMTMIYNALVKSCELAVARGHLGPGTYTGINFKNLNTGDAMPNGYVIQQDSLAAQSSANRALRKAPAFYVTIKEAGAVHSITIQVLVDL
ncbi:DUF3383 domain-containing protein [bacterium]|nr:DUF3383 domain-containing protein [bacterium]